VSWSPGGSRHGRCLPPCMSESRTAPVSVAGRACSRAARRLPASGARRHEIRPRGGGRVHQPGRASGGAAGARAPRRARARGEAQADDLAAAAILARGRDGPPADRGAQAEAATARWQRCGRSARPRHGGAGARRRARWKARPPEILLEAASQIGLGVARSPQSPRHGSGSRCSRPRRRAGCAHGRPPAGAGKVSAAVSPGCAGGPPAPMRIRRYPPPCAFAIARGSGVTCLRGPLLLAPRPRGRRCALALGAAPERGAVPGCLLRIPGAAAHGGLCGEAPAGRELLVLPRLSGTRYRCAWTAPSGIASARLRPGETSAPAAADRARRRAGSPRAIEIESAASTTSACASHRC